MRFILISLTLALCGCAVVYSNEPVGAQAQRIDPSDWDGLWVDDDDASVARVRVVDPDHGVFVVESDDDDTAVQQHIGFVRNARGLTFVSFAECTTPVGDETTCASDTAADRFLWGVVRVRPDLIIAWAPDGDAFGKLIAAGELPGQRADGDYRLFSLGDPDYALMQSEPRGRLFEWTTPAVFRRVAR